MGYGNTRGISVWHPSCQRPLHSGRIVGRSRVASYHFNLVLLTIQTQFGSAVSDVHIRTSRAWSDRALWSANGYASSAATTARCRVWRGAACREAEQLTHTHRNALEQKRSHSQHEALRQYAEATDLVDQQLTARDQLQQDIERREKLVKRLWTLLLDQEAPTTSLVGTAVDLRPITSQLIDLLA